MAIVDVVSERSDVQMQSAREEKRKAAKRGAKTVRDEVKNVLREVAPAVGTLAFRSQRGQDAFRMAMQTEPGSVVSGERREKRKLPHGLTMPTYDSARKQRVETKAELAARTDVVYIAKDDAGNFVELGVCPENDADLVGVCFDLLAQFETALDLDERSGQLQPAPVLAPGSDPPPLHLQIVVGSDGVDNVVGCLARVLDRRKLLYKRGRSRLLRVLLAWTPQSAIRKLAFMRNAQLSKLVNARCVEQRCVAIVELSCAVTTWRLRLSVQCMAAMPSIETCLVSVQPRSSDRSVSSSYPTARWSRWCWITRGPSWRHSISSTAARSNTAASPTWLTLSRIFTRKLPKRAFIHFQPWLLATTRLSLQSSGNAPVGLNWTASYQLSVTTIGSAWSGCLPMSACSTASFTLDYSRSPLAAALGSHWMTCGAVCRFCTLGQVRCVMCALMARLSDLVFVGWSAVAKAICAAAIASPVEDASSTSVELTAVQRCCLVFVSAATNALCDIIAAQLSDAQREKLPRNSLLFRASLYKHTPAHLVTQVRVSACVAFVVFTSCSDAGVQRPNERPTGGMG
jgi:hypothetical protein